MSTDNLLRKQVASELKKRRFVFCTIMFLILIYIGMSFTMGDSGLLKYLELKDRKARLEEEIKEIESKNARLKSELRLLKEDPFYIEKHAREDFGMARPDEYIFKYDQ